VTSVTCAVDAFLDVVNRFVDVVDGFVVSFVDVVDGFVVSFVDVVDDFVDVVDGFVDVADSTGADELSDVSTQKVSIVFLNSFSQAGYAV